MARLLTTLIAGIGISLMWGLNGDFTETQLFVRTAATTFVVNQTYTLGILITKKDN